MSSPSSTESWATTVGGALVDGGIDALCYLPDFVTDQVQRAVDDRVHTVRVNREEEGIGIAAGLWFGGRHPACLMQMTGLGNAITGVLTVLVAMEIPVLLVISLRGDLHEFNPTMIPMGQATEPLLEAMRVPHYRLDNVETARDRLLGAIKTMRTGRAPVALLLTDGLTGGKHG